MPAQRTVLKNTKIELPDVPDQNNVALAGWYGAQGVEPKTYFVFDEVTITENTVFTAIWGAAEEPDITVTFQDPGGSGGQTMPDPIIVPASGGQVELPDVPDQNNVALAGWFGAVGVEAKTYFVYDIVTITENTVFTAIWGASEETGIE
jgi:hypothetical protein